MRSFVSILFAAGSLLIAACTPEAGRDTPSEPPVRGLVTQVVSVSDDQMVRRYPGVLEPAEITALSFKVAGKLTGMSLQVGQTVEQGEVLAAIDDTTFVNTIEERKATIAQAEARLQQAEDALERQSTLFERNVVSRVAVSDAQTEVRAREAELTRARTALANAEEDLADTKLVAPFTGLINAVEADSFQTVSAGTPVLSIYSAGAFEVSFSVNYRVAARLVVGTPAKVRLADDPNTVLPAVVSELGERADTVSSFPVVVRLTDTAPFIKAGMAVEVSLEFPLPANRGYEIPLSAALKDGTIPADHRAGQPVDVAVFVYDPDTSTVKRRTVTMAGIRGNRLLVIDGLGEGERIAVAGVSYLRDGMRVKLVDRKI